jgi:general secretion pathway protein A
VDYFSILSLNKEPFSNSPDPEFFYSSRQHLECLQKLELSLRLRRGLNVVIGDVGTGKTTLCRQLIRRFAESDDIETHLILDPSFSTSTEFLTTVAQLFTPSTSIAAKNDWQLKELIKHYLFHSGVDGQKKVVLLIDEGQKIPSFCLEILREFLNYETNQYKLLQIIIFAQEEFTQTVEQYPNFSDRISLYHHLKPISFRDTRMMIKFRLERSQEDASKSLDLFTLAALLAIYRGSGGYPRKIINLCHQSILAMIIQNRLKVRYSIVRGCRRRAFSGPSRKRGAVGIAALAAAGLAVLFLFMPFSDRIKALRSSKDPGPQTVRFQVETPQTGAPPPLTAVNSGAEDERLSQPPAQTTDKPVSEPVAAVEAKPDPANGPDPATRPLPAAGSVSQFKPGPADKLPSSATNRETVQSVPADILGRITLQPNDTISGLIRKIYGNFSGSYMRSLLAANPGIANPNRVEVGQIVSFPAVAASFKPLDHSAWWIILQINDSLSTAFDFLRTYPDRAPPARVIPYWNPREGLNFAVVVRPYFTEEKAARDVAERLPPALTATAQIMSLYHEDNVYFTNPFLFK